MTIHNDRRVIEVLARLKTSLGYRPSYCFDWQGPDEDKLSFVLKRQYSDAVLATIRLVPCDSGNFGLLQTEGEVMQLMGLEERNLLFAAMYEEWIVDDWDNQGRPEPRAYLEGRPDSRSKDNAVRLQLMERMASAATFDRKLQTMTA